MCLAIHSPFRLACGLDFFSGTVQYPKAVQMMTMSQSMGEPFPALI
ncbi:hypothetical protein THTE_1931 [Thermogutta terrifontis]|uniref:Uncharacterized protein n=1 Tax=Thermogutta terrifontis TaxID=1331910 RepID=A0A286RF03_9BACT|nr:hypothetical protein THTE_1931 [Thermogutta terrifontis]